MEHLKGLRQLQELGLSGTEVTDAGLEHLKGLRQLEKLDLYDTGITDAGLAHLKGFGERLQRTLHVASTKVKVPLDPTERESHGPQFVRTWMPDPVDG